MIATPLRALRRALRKIRPQSHAAHGGRAWRLLSLALVPAIAAVWFGAFALPVLADNSVRGAAATHLTVIDLTAEPAARIASQLRRYTATRVGRLVIVEPADTSSACQARKPGGKLPLPYCGELSEISGHLPNALLVTAGAATDPTAGSVRGGPGYASKLMKTLYGPDVMVTGGPFAFTVTVPAIPGHDVGLAIAAAFVLAAVAAGVSFWFLRRWFRARRIGQQPAPVEVIQNSRADMEANPPDLADGAGSERVVNHVQPTQAASGPELPSAFPLVGGPSKVSRLPWGLPRQPSPPAIAADSARVGDLDVRAASLVGPGHRAQPFAISRQDAYRLGWDPSCRYLLVAVADGMSDSEYSHIGADVAASALVECLRVALGRGENALQLSAPAVFGYAARRMMQHAKDAGLQPDAIRTVALAAVIPVQADRAGRRDAWLAALGDASAWRRHPNGWRRLMGAEKTGLDLNVLSEYLPYHPDSAVSRVAPLKPGDVLTLATDGVADAFTEISGAAAWFAERWRRPPHIGSFFLDVGYEAKTYQDDRTAVTVWCGTDAEAETMHS